MSDPPFPQAGKVPLHVAIIMDGNGRWAVRQGRLRIEGHRAGAKAVQRVVEAASDLGIHILTLYAFSSDNWRRPADEVEALMRLLVTYLQEETDRCVEKGVRVNVIGRRDRLPGEVVQAIAAAEQATARGELLLLRIAVDYSARDAILRAARRVNGHPDLTREAFSRLLADVDHGHLPVPEVDLLIRTGGEQRLSDFLLWESAYAELYFIPKMWPEFDAVDLQAALQEFYRRERRFGRVQDSRAGRARSMESLSPVPRPHPA